MGARIHRREPDHPSDEDLSLGTPEQLKLLVLGSANGKPGAFEASNGLGLNPLPRAKILAQLEERVFRNHMIGVRGVNGAPTEGAKTYGELQ